MKSRFSFTFQQQRVSQYSGLKIDGYKVLLLTTTNFKLCGCLGKTISRLLVAIDLWGVKEFSRALCWKVINVMRASVCVDSSLTRILKFGGISTWRDNVADVSSVSSSSFVLTKLFKASTEQFYVYFAIIPSWPRGKKMSEVHCRLLGTDGFHVKAKNERFTACRLALSCELQVGKFQVVVG